MAMKTMMLPVKLTDDEILARAKELTGVLQEHREAENRIESLTAGFKSAKAHAEAEVEEIAGRVHHIAAVVRNGSEDRSVEVEDIPDFVRGLMLTRRSDTDELVGSRTLTEDERQRTLFVVPDQAAEK